MEKLFGKRHIPEKNVDAVLVHGYWVSASAKPHDAKLSVRSRLAVRAGAQLFKDSGAKHIVVDLGHLWGENYPASGELMAKSLESKYHIPKEAIIFRDTSYSTGGEVKTFLELAKEHGWQNLADVAFAKHHITIPGIYNAYNNNLSIEYRSVESILDKKGSAKRFFDMIPFTHEAVYLAYEIGKWVRMHMPRFNYEQLEQKNKDTRKAPGKESPIPFDVYALPA